MSLNVNLDIAKRLDITCRKGDTFNLEFLIKDASGNPIDVKTGESYNFKMQVRSSDDGTVLIDTSAEGFSITGTAEGVINVTASATVMSGVQSGVWVYDFQSEDLSNSNIQTWFYGIFKINEDVTEMS